MENKFIKIYELLGKIRPLIEKKLDFPKELELSKEFYEKIHNIGYEDIIICEKIINISNKVLKNLEEIKNQFSQSEYNIVKTVCEKTITAENEEIGTILDMLINVDKSIKYWRGVDSHLLDNIFLKYGINPDIFDIDVI